tara:strand:- start:3946 stop:4170 length:225 start_codon:yes stop_codon:yes gene_type:complete
MNTSEPEGYVTTSKYFKLRDDSSDTESDSDIETDSESDSSSGSGIDRVNIGMLKGYMKPKHYKKILVEEDLLPD